MDTVKKINVGGVVRDIEDTTARESMHSHTNKTVIDKFSESADGNLLFNGEEIRGGGSDGSSYTLPTASSSKLGGIKVGENLTIDENGVLSAESAELPTASSSKLGGIKVGENLTIDENGVLDASSVINVSGITRTMPSDSEIFSYNYEELFSSSTGQGSPNNVFANNKYPYLINWQPASGDNEPYVGIRIANEKILTKAQIWIWTGSANANTIKVWVEGSSDGETWTILTAPAPITGDAEILPVIGINKKFTRFRLRSNLNFRDVCGADRYVIGTLELYGSDTKFEETSEEFELDTLKLNDDFYIKNGTVCVAKDNFDIDASSGYTLPAASSSALGGIKVGTGLSITEDGTLSATGGSTSSGGNYNVGNLTLNGIDEYSEDEIVVGKWIDGKPVYRRTIHVVNISNGSDTNLCTIQNLGILLNSKINSITRVGANNSNWGKGEFYITGSDFLSSIISATGDNVTIVFKWSLGDYSNAYVTIEYTKTTDDENSFTADMLPNITVGLGETITEEELNAAIADDVF